MRGGPTLLPESPLGPRQHGARVFTRGGAGRAGHKRLDLLGGDVESTLCAVSIIYQINLSLIAVPGETVWLSEGQGPPSGSAGPQTWPHRLPAQWGSGAWPSTGPQTYVSGTPTAVSRPFVSCGIPRTWLWMSGVSSASAPHPKCSFSDEGGRKP